MRIQQAEEKEMETSAKKKCKQKEKLTERARGCGYSEAAYEIGSRIKELRDNQKLSQDKFCDVLADFQLDISASTLSKYENGNSIIPSDFLWILATCFQCDITYLLTGERKKDSALRAQLEQLLQE